MELIKIEIYCEKYRRTAVNLLNKAHRQAAQVHWKTGGGVKDAGSL